MIKKIRLMVASLVMMGGVFMMAQPVLAADATAPIIGTACKTDKSAICTQLNTDGATGATKLVQNIINTLLYILGIIAVIVIIVGGLRYVTSDGDSSKLKSAKDTILYAIIGLIVAMLAFTIVNFVIKRFK